VGVSQTAAFNRGRHLYSAGRPSGWALAHIFSCSFLFFPSSTNMMIIKVIFVYARNLAAGMKIENCTFFMATKVNSRRSDAEGPRDAVCHGQHAANESGRSCDKLSTLNLS